MKVVIQKSKKAQVTVSDEVIGKIDFGLVVLVGFTEGDGLKEIEYMVNKIVNLRIFDDEYGIMNKSVIDVNGSILSISQFTLYGDARKGNRPSYIKALNEKKARELYDLFNTKLKETNVHIESGKFQADMLVSLENDGPTTIIIEKEGNNNE